jgi:hypothetical protein
VTSMRKLRRRLLRWQRYATRCDMPLPGALTVGWNEPLAGHWRAFRAVNAEEDRRRWGRPR